MSSRPPLSLEALRQAIQKRVDETNGRAVADEIGMAHSALARFLRGETKRPQRDTLRRMMWWYDARSGASPTQQLEDIELAKSRLTSWVGDPTKGRLVRERRLRNLIQEFTEASKASSEEAHAAPPRSGAQKPKRDG